MQGHIRLKILGYTHAARPNGMDAKTIAEGLRYDGLKATEETVKEELALMKDDGFMRSKLDPLTKGRLLWCITDAGIQTGMEAGVIA